MATMPLAGLSSETKFLLSTLLNPTKVMPSANGLPRDWRGVADLFQLSGEMIPSIASQSDPTGYILDTVIKKNPKTTVKELQTILEKIDRWDVIDDIQSLIEKDSGMYLQCEERSLTSPEAINTEVDNQMLTVDDIYRTKAGLSTQLYDAFLLYADDDAHFAERIIEVLEAQNNLKLCVKDRDLIIGLSFEHEAVMQLISERCNRLLVIFSPNFIKSPANEFFLNYAQAVSIERRQKKIIPCVYEWCQLPPQLKHYTVLDYTRSTPHFNFWTRLRCSVEAVAFNTSIGHRSQARIGFPEATSTMKRSPLAILNASEPKITELSIESKVEESHESSKIVAASITKPISQPRELSELTVALTDDDSGLQLSSLHADSIDSSPVSAEVSTKAEKKRKSIKTSGKKMKILGIKF